MFLSNATKIEAGSDALGLFVDVSITLLQQTGDPVISLQMTIDFLQSLNGFSWFKNLKFVGGQHNSTTLRYRFGAAIANPESPMSVRKFNDVVLDTELRMDLAKNMFELAKILNRVGLCAPGISDTEKWYVI